MKVVDTCRVSLFTLPSHPHPYLPPTHSVQQENHDTSQMQDSVSSSGHLVMVVEREKERKSEVPEPSLGTPEYSNKFYSMYVVEILLSHIILVLQCLSATSDILIRLEDQNESTFCINSYAVSLNCFLTGCQENSTL